MEATHNYRFEDLVHLCREHYQEIEERKELSYLLQKKKVRYIDPEGHFGYTTFGNFYFDSRDVMILVTKEFPIVRHHRPDSMRDTLWSTIPVLFAGIETGMKDSKGQDIYSCDVLSVSEPATCEGIVYWYPSDKIPCVLLDNHCLFFDEIKKCEVMGNIFYDIEELDYEYYYLGKFWDHNPVCYGPVDARVWEEGIEKIKKAPTFLNWKPQPPERYSMMYLHNITEVGLRKDDVLVAFCEDREYDPNDENTFPTVYLDFNSIPEEYDNHWEFIPINVFHPDWEKVENRVNEILLEAHKWPDRRYFLCDIKESIPNKQKRDEIGRIFHKATEFQIRNFIMPFDIAMYE